MGFQGVPVDHKILQLCAWAVIQCNPGLPWNKQAVMPALYLAQVREAASALTWEGEAQPQRDRSSDVPHLTACQTRSGSEIISDPGPAAPLPPSLLPFAHCQRQSNVFGQTPRIFYFTNIKVNNAKALYEYNLTHINQILTLKGYEPKTHQHFNFKIQDTAKVDNFLKI